MSAQLSRALHRLPANTAKSSVQETVGQAGSAASVPRVRRLPARLPIAHPAPALRLTTRPAPANWQEEYIKEEQKNLKNELLRASEEVKRIQVGGRGALSLHTRRCASGSSGQASMRETLRHSVEGSWRTCL